MAKIQSDIGIAMANGQLPTEFEHDRRKKVAIKCLELEGMLESQGYSKQDIHNRVASFRTLLLRQPYHPATTTTTIKENHHINGLHESNSVLKNDVYATNPKLHLRSPESHSRKKKKKRKDHSRRRRRSRSKSRRSKKKKGKRSRSSRSDRSPSPDRRSTTKEDKLNEPLKIDTTTNQDILEVDQPSASSGIGPSPKNDSESPKDYHQHSSSSKKRNKKSKKRSRSHTRSRSRSRSRVGRSRSKSNERSRKRYNTFLNKIINNYRAELLQCTLFYCNLINKTFLTMLAQNMFIIHFI